MQTNTNGMGRRQFLKASGVALATTVVVPKLMAGMAGLQPKRVAVGFVPLDAEGADRAVMSAERITSGDGGFIRHGARVTILGVAGVSKGHGARRAVELQVLFTADGQEVPVTAWGASRGYGSSGKTVSFTVPVDTTQQLRFAVRAQRDLRSGVVMRRYDAPVTEGEVVSENASLPITLSLLSDGHDLKLARGYYILAPLFEADADPSWSSFSLRKQENGALALFERSLFDSQPASFEHFIIRVDHETPKSRG